MTENHQDAVASSDSIAPSDINDASFEDTSFDGDMQDESAEEEAPVSETFAGVSPALRDAMVRRGFTDLTAVQKAVLGDELNGKDLRISSQTGSGKTVALGIVSRIDMKKRQTRDGSGVLPCSA